MPILELGIPTLLLLALIFFLVFFYICRIWARPMHPEKCTVIGLMMAFLFTFWFLFIGFLILVALLFLWPIFPNFRGIWPF